jgi:hypothetical protein
MVCGIVGLALSFIICLWPIAVLSAITGAILSGIALGTAKKAGRKKGMAVAGLVCSIIAVVWIPIYVFLIMQALTSSLWSL